MHSLIDGVLGDAPATAGQRTAVAAPPRPRQPIQWPPRPLQEPEQPARRVGLWTRANTAMRGSTENSYNGLRTRTRVVLVLAITTAVVVAAITTTRALATASSTNFAGVLTAQSPVQLNFGVTGTLQTINVVPGQTVKAGQVLATEESAALAQAVKSDDIRLAADEQRLGDLLGKSGKLAAQQAAQAYQKVQSLASSQEQRGAAAVSQEESVLGAAEQSVANWSNQLASDNATYNSRCKGLGEPGCAGLSRTVATDRIQLAAAQSRVSEAQAGLNSAEGIQTTLNGLASQEVTLANANQATLSPTMLDDITNARDAVANDQAQAAADLQSLEYGTLVSPVDGTVFAVYGQPGELVGPSGGHAGSSSGGSALPGSGAGSGTSPATVGGLPSGTQPLITIDANPGLEAIAQVPEADIAKILPGSAATVSVDALDGRTFQAKVEAVEQVPVDVQGSVYYDVILVPAGAPWKGSILPGMTANIDTAP